MKASLGLHEGSAQPALNHRAVALRSRRIRSVAKPNPAVKKKKRELGRLKVKLTKAEQTYGQKAHDNILPRSTESPAIA